MASASSPPTIAANASELPQSIPQPTQPSRDPSLPINMDDADRDSSEQPRKSLFGPFPPSIDTDESEEQTTSLPPSTQPPTSPPSDQIEPSTRNQLIEKQPALSFNAKNQEASLPNETNKTALPPLIREKTAPAIGPATEKPTPVPKESEVEGPVLYITLLLSSTGARHPYKLDEKYLRKRNVAVDGNNPINMSLYKLKELILRDWRDEWEAKPSSPDSIRLISMGKMLNDKAKLSDSGFSNGLTPHIIHMTIKPQEIVDEEDAKMKAGGNSRGENERSPGCRCIVQ